MQVPLFVAGDFDRDGTVDGADLLKWQRAVDMDDSTVDANDDGIVDGEDLAIWRDISARWHTRRRSPPLCPSRARSPSHCFRWPCCAPPRALSTEKVRPAFILGVIKSSAI